jgi:hypothetical protein
MKWFRSRIKAGTRLALLALAVQFVLSFGHFHGVAALAAPGVANAASSAAASSPGQAANTPVAADEAQRAPDRSHGDHHDGYCAICAVMSLAGTALISGPAILLIPEAYQVLSRTTDAEFSHLASPHGISQPRAPPAS